MKLRKGHQSRLRTPASRELIEKFECLLQEDGITPRRIHEQIVSLIKTKARQFPLDPATALRPDVGIYLDQGEPEGRWRHELFEARATFSEGLRGRTLRRAAVHAQELGANLYEVVAAVDAVLAGYASETEHKIREAESSAHRWNSALRKLRDSDRKGDDGGGNGLLGGILGLFNGVADGSRALAAFNMREIETFRAECAQVQLAAWEDIRQALQALPAQIATLEETLTSALQTATLSHVPREDIPPSRHSGISWEPIGPLAERLAQRDVQPSLPDDILIELLQGEDVALGLLERDAKAKATQLVNQLAIGGLQHLHGRAMKDANRQMLLYLNFGAGESPQLFQIGEKSPESGELSFVWPAIRQQVDVLATDGLSVAVGFLRIDPPTDAEEIFGPTATERASSIEETDHTQQPDHAPNNNGVMQTIH